MVSFFSPGSGVSQEFSPGKASHAGSCNSGIAINHGTSFNSSGFTTPACPSPTTTAKPTMTPTMTSTATPPSSVGSPTGAGVLYVSSADSASPNQQQHRPMLLLRRPSPSSLGEVSENYGLGRARAGTGVMVGTLRKKAGGLDGERSLSRFSFHIFSGRGILFKVVF